MGGYLDDIRADVLDLFSDRRPDESVESVLDRRIYETLGDADVVYGVLLKRLMAFVAFHENLGTELEDVEDMGFRGALETYVGAYRPYLGARTVEVSDGLEASLVPGGSTGLADVVRVIHDLVTERGAIDALNDGVSHVVFDIGTSVLDPCLRNVVLSVLFAPLYSPPPGGVRGGGAVARIGDALRAAFMEHPAIIMGAVGGVLGLVSTVAPPVGVAMGVAIVVGLGAVGGKYLYDLWRRRNGSTTTDPKAARAAVVRALSLEVEAIAPELMPVRGSTAPAWRGGGATRPLCSICACAATLVVGATFLGAML